MSTPAYTDSEIKDVFQTLFAEKKKVKELQQQIALLSQNPLTLTHPQHTEALNEENTQLKQRLANLKKKYENALSAPQQIDPEFTLEIRKQKSAIQSLEESNHLLEEENNAFLLQLKNLKDLLLRTQDERDRLRNETVQTAEENGRIRKMAAEARDEAECARQESAQAKNALNDLRAQLKEAPPAKQTPQSLFEDPDMDILRQRNQELEDRIKEVEEQNRRHRIRLEKLAEVIQEKEKRVHELQQYEFTHKKTSEIRQDLQSSLEMSKQEIAKLQNELTDSRQHGQQLERVIKFLREKSEEGQLAAKQFKQDLELSQDTIAKLEKSLHITQEQLSTLKHTSLHVGQEKQALQQELSALKAKYEELTRTDNEIQQEKHKLEYALKQAEELAVEEQENSLGLAEQLSQQNQLVENARKEIEIIKQALIRGMREASELDARYKESVQEKVAAFSKLHHARQQFEKLQEEAIQFREEAKQAEESLQRELSLVQKTMQNREEQHNAHIDALMDQLEQTNRELEEAVQIGLDKNTLQESHDLLKAELAQKTSLLEAELEQKTSLSEEIANARRTHAAELERIFHEHQLELAHSRREHEQERERTLIRNQEYERSYQELQEAVTRLALEKQQAENAHNQARAEADDKDTQIKMAQQHLAKKVKESAYLADELEKSKRQISDLQQQHVQHQIRTAELQASLDIHLAQEKKLQDQLAELIKTYDTQMKKWEQKYFDMHDKWQATEIRKKELEKLEERHVQMQALLSNLGSVLGGSPVGSSTVPPPSYDEHHPTAQVTAQVTTQKNLFQQEPEETLKVEEAPQKPYQNLFNMPLASKSPRQNLFD